MNNEIAELKQIIEDSDNIVFFGGAGVSPKAIYRISEVKTVYIMR